MSPVKIEYMRAAFSQDKYASVLLNNSTQCYYLDKNTSDIIDKFKRFYSRHIARYIASENQNDQQVDIVDEVFNVGEIYVERGFVRSFTRLTPGILPKTTKPAFRLSDVASGEAFEYVEAIISLCYKNNIQPILFIPPWVPSSVIGLDGYAEFNSFMHEYAGERGTVFIDFNMLLPEYIAYSDEMFRDRNHMNELLIPTFSNFFADLLNEYIETGAVSDKYFYSSYDEYYEQFQRVGSVWLEKGDKNELVATAVAGPVEVEYQFSYAVLPKGNSTRAEKLAELSYTVFREYDADNTAEFLRPDTSGEETTYAIRVEARAVGGSDDEKQMSFTVL